MREVTSSIRAVHQILTFSSSAPPHLPQQFRLPPQVEMTQTHLARLEPTAAPQRWVGNNLTYLLVTKLNSGR